MKRYRTLCAVLSAALMMTSGNAVYAEVESDIPAEEASSVSSEEVSSTEESSAEEKKVYEKGDVSGDGNKDIEDVVLTMMYINGQRVLEEEAFNAADVTEDGIVDIEDVVNMLDNINGNKAIVVRPDPPESSEDESSEPSDSSQPDSQPDDSSQPDNSSEAEPADDLSELKKQVLDHVHGYDGNWSVYVKNLDTGVVMSINDRVEYPASIIKLYAMGDAYDKIEQGILSKSELSGYLRSMITVSDNNSFNYIVNKLGTDEMTQWCKDHGYTDTVVAHKLPNYYYDRPYNYGDNKTSASDAGKILEDIYTGRLVSEEASKEMYSLLLDQQRRSKIPAGLPWGTKCANKTGETDDFCHDAAIVCSGGANYVITVMVEYHGNAYSCNNNIANVSRIVYNYFNP